MASGPNTRRDRWNVVGSLFSRLIGAEEFTDIGRILSRFSERMPARPPLSSHKVSKCRRGSR